MKKILILLLFIIISCTKQEEEVICIIEDSNPNTIQTFTTNEKNFIDIVWAGWEIQLARLGETKCNRDQTVCIQCNLK